MVVFHQKMEAAEVAVWEITETLEELQTQLSEKELFANNLQSVKNTNRQLEILGTRVLLKHLLGSEVEVGHQANGEPFLAGFPEKRISISHTSHYAAVILAEGKRVGIDIERKGREQILRIKHKFLSDRESDECGNDLTKLLLYWCAKETTFKLSEESLPEFSKEMAVQPFGVKNEGKIDIETKSQKSRQIFTLNYILFKDFVLVFGIQP